MEWEALENKEYWAGFLLGALAIALFAFDQFRKPSDPEDPARLETLLPPNELTTKQEYLVSFFIYFLGLELVYVLLSLMGPNAFTGGLFLEGENATGTEAVAASSAPLWIALLLVGVFPRSRWLSRIEETWRKWMHRRASIPEAVRSIANELKGGDFVFPEAFYEEVEQHANQILMSRSDLDAEQGSMTHQWARLSALVDRLQRLEVEPNASKFLGIAFLQSRKSAMSLIVFDYRQLREKLRGEVTARLQEESNTDKAHDAAEHQHHTRTDILNENAAPIIGLLDRIYVLLGCAIIQRPIDVRIRESTSFIGFEGDQGRPDDAAIEWSASILGILSLVLVAFLDLNFAPFFADRMGPGWPEESFVYDPKQALGLCLNLLFLHGAAVVAALAYRRRRIGKRTWIASLSTSSFVMTYLAVFAGASFVSTCAYLLILLPEASILAFVPARVIPFGLVGGASGLFVVILLDCTRFERGPRVVIPVLALQVACSALFAWIAATLFVDSRVTSLRACRSAIEAGNPDGLSLAPRACYDIWIKALDPSGDVQALLAQMPEPIAETGYIASYTILSALASLALGVAVYLFSRERAQHAAAARIRLGWSNRGG